jgi:hypothetical protein
MTTVLRYASDNLIEIRGPVNGATGAPITSAASCVGRLFYDEKDTTLRANVSSGTALSVTSTRKWAVGDRALIWRDTAVWVDLGLVTVVDHTTNTLTVTNAVPGLCSKGNRVSHALGTGTQHEFTLSFYQGTIAPAAGRLDYGFRGTVPDTQVGLSIGDIIRIEVDLDASAGVRLTEIFRAYVTGGS